MSMTAPLAPITLILGGQRSGKSALAEHLIIDAAGGGVYVATAEPVASGNDAEMAERIKQHRDRRGPGWTAVEEPLDILPVILENAAPDRPVLVDCLTLWLANLMEADGDAEAAVEALALGLTEASGPVILVSNEVGLGIIPDNALARRYADAAGRMNQRLAKAATRVLFTAAGLPLTLKDETTNP